MCMVLRREGQRSTVGVELDDQYALGVTSHLQTATVGEISRLLRFHCVLLFLFRVIQTRNGALLRILLRTPWPQGMLNRSRERLQFEIPVMSLVVDEECWRPVDAASDTARKVALNPIPELGADERLLQSASIEFETLR